MSIRADILQAKDEYHKHLEEHKCGVMTRCAQRTEFWDAWMGTAEHWGIEYDDDSRQRDHYNQQFGIH